MVDIPQSVQILGPVDLPCPFGRYRLISLLGTGATSQVYRAERTIRGKVHKPVALKIITALHANVPVVQQALLNEARLGSFFDHPNLVRIFDHGVVQGRLYLATELVDGLTLAQALATGGAIPPNVVRDIATLVCLALERIHNLEVEPGRPVQLIHRDLKPSNILLDWEGRVKVADLGIAKGLLLTTYETQTGLVRGTPSYMSPEQAEDKDLDGRSDLFSLATVVYEMLLGQRLFTGKSIASVLLGLVQVQKRLDLTSFWQPIDARHAGLGAVLRRCLQVDPAARYGSASELRVALESLTFSADEPQMEVWLGGIFRAWNEREQASGAPATTTIGLTPGGGDATDGTLAPFSVDPLAWLQEVEPPDSIEAAATLLAQLDHNLAGLDSDTRREAVRHFADRVPALQHQVPGSGERPAVLACTATGQLWQRGRRLLQLRPDELTWRLAIHLFQHRGQDPSSIYPAVWGNRYQPPSSDNALYVTLQRLREELGETSLSIEVDGEGAYQVRGNPTLWTWHPSQANARGERQGLSPIHRPGAGVPAATDSFIGREPELAQLSALLEAGQRLITVRGPPGTGKTRLCLEFARATPDPQNSAELIELEDRVVDLSTRTVQCGETTTKLTPKEVDALRYLSQRPFVEVPTQELLCDVWKYHPEANTRAVNHAIQRLRRKLETDASKPRHLLTVRGIGYRFEPRAQADRSTAQSTVMGSPIARRTWFCDLTESRTLSGLLNAVATTLDVSLTGAHDDDAIVTHLGHALAEQGPALLILDNAEQARDAVAHVVTQWLGLAAETHILVTSRVSLGLANEQLFALEPLGVPDGTEFETVSDSDAVTLFTRRAQRVQPDFAMTPDNAEAVHSIVTQLDGMPLAIELAAARVRMMSPHALAQRLDKRFRLLRRSGVAQQDRRMTLRGALDDSWDLLVPWEKGVLAQCSVFQGGFTLEAAEAVLDLSPWPNAPWALDVLESLLDHSLLKTQEFQSGNRFSMYQSIHAYAEDKLAEQGLGQKEAFRRHGAFYRRFGEEEHLEPEQPIETVQLQRWLGPELENLVAATKRALDAGQPHSAALCCLGSIGTTTAATRGPAVALADGVLGLDLAPHERARLLRRAGWLHHLLGHTDRALEYHHCALAIHREAGNRRIEGILLRNLGIIHLHQDQMEEALECNERALDILRETGNRRIEGQVLGNQGLLHMRHGRMEEALEQFNRALDTHRETGNRRGEGITLGNLGILHSEMGLMEDAKACNHRAVDIHREVGNRRLEGSVIGFLGWLHIEQGRMDDGLESCNQALVIHREVGNRRNEAHVLEYLGILHSTQGRMAEAMDHHTQALQMHREVGNRQYEVHTLGSLGDLLLKQGDLEAAEKHITQGMAVADTHHQEQAGSLRGSLAVIRAQQGAIDRARELLTQGEAFLRGVSVFGLGKLLCQRGQVEVLANNPPAAQAALSEAVDIARKLSAGPNSALGQAIAALRTSLES